MTKDQKRQFLPFRTSDPRFMWAVISAGWSLLSLEVAEGSRYPVFWYVLAGIWSLSMLLDTALLLLGERR